MLQSVLSDLIYQIYNSGRPKSSNRNYDERDVLLFSKVSLGNVLRVRYYEGIKNGGGQDLYFLSPLLSIQEFPLNDADIMGVRRADMSAFDMYRAPHNSNIVNIYPKGCDTVSKAISLVEPGEEYFYTDGKFSAFKFGVVKGRGINTYHLPPCVKALVVEATFDGEDKDGNPIDVDIPHDIAYDVSNQVLNRLIGIPDFMNKNVDNPYALPMKNLKQKLAPQSQPE